MKSKLQKRKEALARRLQNVAHWRQRAATIGSKGAAERLRRAERDVAALRAKLQAAGVTP